MLRTESACSRMNCSIAGTPSQLSGRRHSISCLQTTPFIDTNRTIIESATRLEFLATAFADPNSRVPLQHPTVGRISVKTLPFNAGVCGEFNDSLHGCGIISGERKGRRLGLGGKIGVGVKIGARVKIGGKIGVRVKIGFKIGARVKIGVGFGFGWLAIG